MVRMRKRFFSRDKSRPEHATLCSQRKDRRKIGTIYQASRGKHRQPIFCNEFWKQVLQSLPAFDVPTGLDALRDQDMGASSFRGLCFCSIADLAYNNRSRPAKPANERFRDIPE